MNVLFFNGLRIVESLYLTEAGEPVTVRRSWRERLLTRPWRPWQATCVMVPQVPRKGGFIMGDTVLMHPATVREIKRRQLAAETGDTP